MSRIADATSSGSSITPQWQSKITLPSSVIHGPFPSLVERNTGFMRVGLGTGSTPTLFIHELGKAVQSGLRIEAIATSDKSSALAKEVGIPLTNFDDTPVLDVNVDGADEVAPGLALIKGGHGAHLREKIVELPPTTRC
jgi:ribose 5-phosphate isomerase